MFDFGTNGVISHMTYRIMYCDCVSPHERGLTKRKWMFLGRFFIFMCINYILSSRAIIEVQKFDSSTLSMIKFKKGL